MTHGITKELVRTVVASLNEKAERLGWVRRYDVQFGSNPNGIKHQLQVTVPPMEHPTLIERFATLSRLHQYLVAMGTVLNDAVSERERERSIVRGGVLALDPGRTYDPDARSVTRANEGFRDGRPIY